MVVFGISDDGVDGCDAFSGGSDDSVADCAAVAIDSASFPLPKSGTYSSSSPNMYMSSSSSTTEKAVLNFDFCCVFG